MDQQIEEMVASDVESSEGIIDGQRQIKNRPPVVGKNFPGRKQGTDFWIADDLRVIVEDEWTRKSVSINQQPYDDDGADGQEHGGRKRKAMIRGGLRNG